MSQNTETTMISERAAVLREREAFKRGARWQFDFATVWSPDAADKNARIAHPLPKVTRPRVVRDSEAVEFRARAGALEFRSESFPHWDSDVMPRFAYGHAFLLAERYRIFADLLANPTEEVDADA